MREEAAFTRIEPPVVRKRQGSAFTLIELLVVIAIIALLVSILVPSLSRATALARKSACAAKLSAHGKAVALFVAENDSYPLFGHVPHDTPYFKILDYPNPGDWDWEHARGWPKTYGVLEAMDIQGTHETNQGQWAYFWEPDEIWDGVLCSAMDAPGILQWSDGVAFGPDDRWMINYHRAAIGYQWNARLRGANPNGLRWTAKLDPRGEQEPWSGGCALIQNVPWRIFLPNNSTEYAAQAVDPEEVVNPSECAEAWDSPDLETLDWVSQNRSWGLNPLMPGFYAGPQMLATKGWAVLPGSRHPKSPNILYADGSVRADATKKLKETDLDACPSGDWTGLNVNSWSDFSATFGTIHHILPDPSF